MENEYQIFSAGLINLAIPTEHFDEAAKVLSARGVNAISEVKTRFPGTHEVPPFSPDTPQADKRERPSGST